LETTGGNRTREATFGLKNWKRTYQGRKPRHYFFGSKGDGPPTRSKTELRETFGLLEITDWPTVGKKLEHFGAKAEIQHRLRGNKIFGFCEIKTTLGAKHFGE